METSWYAGTRNATILVCVLVRRHYKLNRWQVTAKMIFCNPRRFLLTAILWRHNAHIFATGGSTATRGRMLVQGQRSALIGGHSDEATVTVHPLAG